MQKNKVIGTVALEEHTETVAELRRMTVAESSRKMGIAGRLLRTAEDFAKEKKYDAVILGTTSPQTAAIEFYEKHNYRLEEEIPMLGRFPGASSFGVVLHYMKTFGEDDEKED
jgi:ribosomal protein S18 acetylase RimI-like enzyme